MRFTVFKTGRTYRIFDNDLNRWCMRYKTKSEATLMASKWNAEEEDNLLDITNVIYVDFNSRTKKAVNS